MNPCGGKIDFSRCWKPATHQFGARRMLHCNIGVHAGHGKALIICAFKLRFQQAHRMEAEQLNAISNSLDNLARRADELRRYL